MANLEGVSRGCDTCRKRKVKCDANSPRCLRCQRRGQQCPGVVDFKRSRKHCRAAGAAGSKSGSPSPARAVGSVSSANVQLLPSLPQDTHQQHVAFFFNRVVVRIGWLAYLPGVYLQSGEGTALDDFIQAISLNVLGNQNLDSGLRGRGREVYGKALRSLNAAISDTVERGLDRTLFAVGLCKIADEIQGQPYAQTVAHLKGCQQLLDSRKDSGGTMTDAALGMARSLLAEAPKSMAPDAILETDGRFWGDAEECDCAVQMFQACTKASQWRQQAKAVQAWDSDALDLFIDGLAIERTLAFWTDGVRSAAYWAHSTHWTWDCVKDRPHGSYSDLGSCSSWNHARCVRLLHAEAIREAAVRLWPVRHNCQAINMQEVINRCGRTIDHMADLICAFIPYHLFEIGKDWLPDFQRPSGLISAAHLIWPLEVIRDSNTNGISRRTARETLNWITTQLGMRQACSSTTGYDESVSNIPIDQHNTLQNFQIPDPARIFSLETTNGFFDLLAFIEDAIESSRLERESSPNTAYTAIERVSMLSIIMLRHDSSRPIEDRLCGCSLLCAPGCVRRTLVSIARETPARKGLF